MKTKLLVLFAAVLTLGSLSSCNGPSGYGDSYSSPPYKQYGNNNNLGGYRGGGGGGGFGGSYGGFGGR